ncbi:mechanosensitive ion channel family protein [Planctobacterium marinum]|uniref:mechanosensitive ion channel family protein n=1 Tax=Planctobacterium marinum TaxID=1631968 RepID=UPI001E48F113|nr:mechanosensitive ion channel family protein [Planctobacterium marinum]MCC2604083.1 mechanosensitive ion channel family protein [Planctobacterium marinum]
MNESANQQLEQVQQIYSLIVNFLVEYSFQLLGALFVFILGLIIARRISSAVVGLCKRKNLDITLSQFIGNVVKITILVMIAIICLNMIGISITPFVAAIGALGLGAGLAVQGLLSNYGAGFNIILARPFVVGDTIRVEGAAGVVREITLAFTKLEDEDGVEILIPNRHIVGEILHNSRKYTLTEMQVGVAYNSDLDQVIALLRDALQGMDVVAQEPPPLIGIAEFADSSVNIELRYWVETDKLFACRYQVNKMIWDTLKTHNIAIPFPQREVTLLSAEGNNA